jgi:hypothetical protein
MAVEEAKSGIYRNSVAQFFKGKKTKRARNILQKMNDLHLAREP